MRLVLLGSALALLFVAPAAPAAEKRPLSVDDLFRLKSVGAPVLSPDGAQVAYTVHAMDPKKDSSDTDIYLISTAEGEARRLTTSPKPETNPRFSPDGKWIAFLSGREGDKTQVWLLRREGGEASRLTDNQGGVSSFASAARTRTAEAKGLDGRSFFPPELAADAKKRLDDNLHAAMESFVRNPDDASNIIWVGRRLGYLSRFREALDVFSRGILKFPSDPRLLRHRGHRYISTRQFDRAIVDFAKASKLMRDRPDEGEPDGAPGRRPSPSSTLKFNIYYHLGLAHYLRGDFAKALAAYRECMKYSHDNDDSLVATSDWLYMTLRRLGQNEEAQKVLEPIKEGMDVLDNAAYYQRLLMYKGLREPEDVLGSDEQDPLQIATQGYGVGNFYLVNGDPERAKAIYKRVVAGSQWAAFGFIAAEADLARMK